MRRIFALGSACFLLSACAQPSQNQYGYQDVGHNALILYGTVKSVRPVAITGQNTGTGALAGVGAGALAGSAIGQGRGSLLGIIGGAVIGGIAGHVAEQAMQDRRGFEYIIRFTSGTTQSVVQNIAKDDQPIEKGECVMVQMNGAYQRVLPADDDDCRSAKPAKKHHHKADDDEGR